MVAEKTTVQSSYEEYIDVLISEGLRDYASVDTLTPLMFNVRGYSEALRASGQRRYLAKPGAMIKKMPGFFFSTYRQLAFNAPMLMRIQDFARVLADLEQEFVQSSTTDGDNDPPPDDDDSADGESSTEDDPNEGTDTGETGGGSISGNTGGGSGGTGPGTPVDGAYATVASVGRWVQSSPAYVAINSTSNGTTGGADVNGTGLNPERAAFDNDGASALYIARDGTPSTVMSGPGCADTAVGYNLTFQLPSCVAVTGIRFRRRVNESAGVNQYAAPSLRWALSGGSGLDGPWIPLAAGDMSTTVQAAGGGWDEALLLASQAALRRSLSAQFWQLQMLPESWSAGVDQVVLLDVQLRQQQARFCEASLITADDAALAVPKQRLMVKLVDADDAEAKDRVLNGLRTSIFTDLIQYVEK